MFTFDEVGWQVSDFRDRLTGRVIRSQSIPLNDIDHHINDEFCWCSPIVNNNNESKTPHIIHRSFDNREMTETKRGDN